MAASAVHSGGGGSVPNANESIGVKIVVLKTGRRRIGVVY